MPMVILKWKNRLDKVRRIHKNSAQNLQVMRSQFSIIWHRILTALPLTFWPWNLINSSLSPTAPKL